MVFGCHIFVIKLWEKRNSMKKNSFTQKSLRKNVFISFSGYLLHANGVFVNCTLSFLHSICTEYVYFTDLVWSQKNRTHAAFNSVYSTIDKTGAIGYRMWFPRRINWTLYLLSYWGLLLRGDKLKSFKHMIQIYHIYCEKAKSALRAHAQKRNMLTAYLACVRVHWPG